MCGRPRGSQPYLPNTRLVPKRTRANRIVYFEGVREWFCFHYFEVLRYQISLGVMNCLGVIKALGPPSARTSARASVRTSEGRLSKWCPGICTKCHRICSNVLLKYILNRINPKYDKCIFCNFLPLQAPGPLGDDPGLPPPVEVHSSPREIPSSAPTASNGRPRIRRIFLTRLLITFSS